ncbi:MAG TPA: class I SAM-dependent methyltransferase [Longimicrobiaceae bacterium]|nr:class I SAM-dependent methyltransferase [Longimicrobiaceae bacterium]
MIAPDDATRRDFDAIARALAGARADDRLRPFERALLSYLPAACGRVLEVGCGHGAITRHLAPRAESVLAIDLSPEMIRLARKLSAAHTAIDYRVADVTTADLPDASFDVVLSAATLHHLPLEPTVRRLAAALRPGGWLVIQDLVTRPGLRYLPLNALALAVQRCRLVGRWPRNRELARLYERHSAGEVYLRPHEVARAYAELLPGARVVHHLEWRYTVTWRKPG